MISINEKLKVVNEKKSILNLLTIGFCSDKSCLKRNEKSSSCPDHAGSVKIAPFCGVHKHNKWYRVLLKEIVEKIVPILHLDDKTIEEEVAAL